MKKGHTILEFAAFGPKKVPYSLLKFASVSSWHYVHTYHHTIGMASIPRELTLEEDTELGEIEKQEDLLHIVYGFEEEFEEE